MADEESTGIEEGDDTQDVVVVMQELVAELKQELVRMKNRKRELVSQARANQLNVGDLAGEVFDEMVQQQAQMISVLETSAVAIDVAFQFYDGVAEHVGYTDEEDGEEGDGDEEEDEDEEGTEPPKSFLTKDDANMIGAAVITALAAIKDAKSGRATDWSIVQSLLEAASVRIVEIEAKDTAH